MDFNSKLDTTMIGFNNNRGYRRKLFIINNDHEIIRSQYEYNDYQ